VPPAVTIPVAPTAATATPTAALPSAAATTPLFGSIAAFAVDRTVPTGFKWHRRGLSATGANHGSARAHPWASARTSAVPAVVLGMGGCVATSAGTLLGLAAWFAAAGRGVAALLEELLFTCGEGKLLTAIATGK
jgi:hypothetical protein